MTNSTYDNLVRGLTSQDVLEEFPDVIPLNRITGSASSDEPLEKDSEEFHGHDQEQIRLMAENCIVVDYDDKVIGAGTKKLCHLMANIEKGLLHRAFSLFLFNDKNELLLQQRATEKITFPDMWTNTCCSHPLSIPSELGDIHTLDNQKYVQAAAQAAKNAAVRKVDHELGIKEIDINKFQFLTRIHYKSPNPTDQKWGEHEVDYIIITKQNIDLAINPNEVRDYTYVSEEKLRTMLEDDKLVFTPWFKLICENYLFGWWDELRNGKTLSLNLDLHHLI